MSLPRIFLYVSLLIFGAIGAVAVVKRTSSKKSASQVAEKVTEKKVIEIDLATLTPSVSKAVVSEAPAPTPVVEAASEPQPAVINDTPEVDRIELLFQKNSKLPIVETIIYKSKVPWKKGRSAWLVDYAAHYKTHLHFIARCLNGRPDYHPRPTNDGAVFNVLSSSVNFYFYLLVDLSRCKLMFYAVMPEKGERVLLKTYRVGLGRIDNTKASGCLTPVGKYSLGSKIAIYQPKMMGSHRGNRVEMITVFGTRWIPFEKELSNCSEPAKSYGIHGTPWTLNSEGKLVDNPSSIGRYESDGCIRLRAQDIEEIFSIVSTHETVIELVSDFSKAQLPEKEKIY